jgi:capsular polysaccharide biosynthesis protein
VDAELLLPDRVSSPRLPVNLRPEDLDLFRNECDRALPRTVLVRMDGVNISPDGVFFDRLRILPQSFAFPDLAQAWPLRHRWRFLIENHLLRRRRTFVPAAVWITDDWSGGYFHWFADALTRLHVLGSRARDRVLLLPHRYADLPFVRPSLKPFDLGGVEFLASDEVVTCRDLLVPMHTAPSGAFDETVIGSVRRLLVDEYTASESIEPAAADALVYISRGAATRRRIVNEPEVVDALGALGFRVVRCEELSWAEQVRLASRARCLVSNHGAGLTNMLFMPAGGAVLELRHQHDRVQNCYFTLASAVGLDYSYQTCAPENPGEAAHTANLRVDVARLTAEVRAMLHRA